MGKNKIMQLDLNEVLKDLQEESLKVSGSGKDFTVGYGLSSILVSASASNDPLRDYLLGKKIIGAEGGIEVNEAEIEALKTAIKDHQTYTVLVKGQLLAKFV